MKVRDYLKDNVLLFDGAMGTYMASRDRSFLAEPERANLEAPELVKAIHTEYLEAGAKAIKTNTFAVNRIRTKEDADELLKTGYQLAVEAAEPFDAAVFADIGPVHIPQEDEKVFAEYKHLVDVFLSLGAENFLFETMDSLTGLLEIASYLKEKKPEAFLLVSFAVLPDGYTREGLFLKEIADTFASLDTVDAFGLNCSQGAFHMKDNVKGLPFKEKTISLMPNAGYPIVINHRTRYEGDPALFGEALSDMVGMGASIVGGCCGTTPLHIRKAVETLGKTKFKSLTAVSKEKKGEDSVVNLFWKKLQRGEKVVAVELDPPETASVRKFMEGVWTLKNAGIDILTIADCPIARARMDSSLLACKVKREVELDVLPHMTCRDRNLNATKALLLGLYAEEVRNVLLVTGDPIPTAERDEVKSVYQFNSRKLASFVRGLGEEILPGGFHIFGALNVNALNFDVQLKMAKEKLNHGMVGFLTQPVLTKEAVDNLKRAHEELDGYILGGLIPIVSERNARFMDSEINGIRVDKKIIEAYVGKDRAESEALAVELTTRIAREIEPYVDGFYFVTPFQRTALIARILEELHL